MFDPQGTVRLIPEDLVDQATQAGGKRAFPIVDPSTGKAHWIPQNLVPDAIKAHGTFVNPEDAKLFQGRNSQPTAQPSAASGGITTRAFGEHPIGDTIGNVGTHLANIVRGPYEAFTKPATEEEKADPLIPSGNAITRGVARMTVEPTIQAAREVVKQARAGNWSSGNSVYDKGGNYRPDVMNSVLDAIPVVGPWARGVETEAVQKGAVPALAGLAADVEGGHLATKAVQAPLAVARGVRNAVTGISSADKLIPKDTVTYRQRYNDAKAQGVNLDMAQATGGTGPAILKRITEHSALGKGPYEKSAASNLEALNSESQRMLNAAHPQAMSREDFGNNVKQRVRESFDKAANDALNAASPNDMPRSAFGDRVKAVLRQHQAMLNDAAGKIYDGLTARKGTRQPNAKGVREAAAQILAENQDYFAKHPEFLSGGVKQAWNIVKSLADNSGDADTWSDMHRLRSDLMDMYRSPDIVGSRSEGWLKQLAGAVDNAMAGAQSGLSSVDRSKFRAANDLYKTMKENYDDPTSPLYSVVRQPDGLTAANTVAGANPYTVGLIKDAAAAVGDAELPGQLQRQTMQRILDPTANGYPDYKGLASRYGKGQKEQMAGILDPDRIAELGALAKDTSSPVGRVLDAEDGTKAADQLLKLTPEGVQSLEEVTRDPDIIGQLQRQTISRILNPAANDLPDFKNLASRFDRAQKDNLAGVLDPEQIDDLEKLARTSRVVQSESNPSGTAKTMQAQGDISAMAAGGVGMLTGLAAGSPATAAAAAAPVAYGVGTNIAGRMINSPSLVDAAMSADPKLSTWKTLQRLKNQPPAPAALAAVPAIQQEQNDRHSDVELGATSSQANQGAVPADKPGMTPAAPVGVPQATLEAPKVQETIPKEVADNLEEGVHHTFANGQTWTLQGGVPRQVTDEQEEIAQQT